MTKHLKDEHKIKIESFKKLVADNPSFKELDYSIKVNFETNTDMFLAGLQIDETKNLLMRKIKKGVFRASIAHMPAVSQSGWELMSELSEEERKKVLEACEGYLKAQDDDK